MNFIDISFVVALQGFLTTPSTNVFMEFSCWHSTYRIIDNSLEYAPTKSLIGGIV
jgi:hypothetical protein